MSGTEGEWVLVLEPGQCGFQATQACQELRQ